MAHSPIVGTGISQGVTAASGMTTSFAIKTPYLRVTARGAGAHVAFSQTAVTVTADTGSYFIPDGTSETLAMSRYSQKVVGITIGATTVLTCPEGQTMPFNVGNVVQLVCPITSSNGDIVNQYNFTAQVTAIDNMGYFFSKFLWITQSLSKLRYRNQRFFHFIWRARQQRGFKYTWRYRKNPYTSFRQISFNWQRHGDNTALDSGLTCLPRLTIKRRYGSNVYDNPPFLIFILRFIKLHRLSTQPKHIKGPY